MLLGTVGCFWVLLGGYFCVLLGNFGTIGCFWVLLVPLGAFWCFGVFWGSFGFFWVLLGALGAGWNWQTQTDYRIYWPQLGLVYLLTWLSSSSKATKKSEKNLSKISKIPVCASAASQPRQTVWGLALGPAAWQQDGSWILNVISLKWFTLILKQHYLSI